VSINKIESLLRESHRRFTPLQRLLKTASDQKQWTAELRAFLEPPLCHAVEVTDIRGPHVHVVCQNAAIATRLRFLLPTLLPQWTALASFHRVTAFKIRIAHQS